MRPKIDDKYAPMLERWGKVFKQRDAGPTIEFILDLIDGDDEEWLKRCREQARDKPKQ